MKYYEFLAKIRKELKWTQRMLAFNMKLKQSEIARIESGRSNPSIKKLKKWANALNRDLVIDFPEKKEKPVNKNTPAKD